MLRMMGKGVVGKARFWVSDDVFICFLKMIDWAVVFRRQSPRYGRVVDGTCGLFEYMKKGRLKTGSPFSDDVFICFLKMIDWAVVFRGQSPRYGRVVEGMYRI